MTRLLALIVLAAAVLGGTAGTALADPAPKPQYGPFYSGQLLVARPTMQDPRFARTVIYLAEHDAKGAFGLIVNRPLGSGPLRDFMKGLKMDPVPDVDGAVDLYAGGPVEPGAGFVLHTRDYRVENTAMIRGDVAVTASLEVVRDIGSGAGPRRHLILLGYSGWGPGQLENELARGDWGIAPYDEAIVFGPDDAGKWERTRETVGIPM